MKHAIGAAIFVILLAAFAWVVLNVNILLPTQASAQAVPIDRLFDLEFKLTAVLFGLIVGIMLYSIVFFRRKKGDESDGPHITGNTPLEIIWTAIPFGIVIGLSLLGSRALADTMRIDPRAVEIKVIGQQWAWRFEYPAYGITSDVLYLPLNRQVVLKITSVDVIHSFWVPEFRVKQDAVPGIERELRVTASKAGEFSLICAEVCGRSHAYMTAVVKVVPEEEFTAWAVGATVAEADPVARGQKLYAQFCKSCHTVDGSRLIGPTFKGLYGAQETLEDDSTVTVDDTYLFDSIRQPGKQIVKGYANIMSPTLTENLTDEQIRDLIAYIESLK